MQGYDVKQSSTAYPLLFLMVDSTDHVTGKTGLSPTVTLSKNGGSFASPSGSVTEIANGWYKVAGNATDTGTLGPLALHATGTAADPVDTLYPVVAYDPQDAVHLGLTALPNTACTTNASLLTSGTSTDQLSVSSGRIDVGKFLGTTSAGAAGYAGVDWGAVTNKTTTNALTGTTISTSQVAASVTGAVGSVTTVSDKTGYALSSAGLNSISTTAPSGVASDFREMMVQVWRRYFKKSVKAVSGLTIKTYADDGTTVDTTQTYTDDGAGNETLNAAS